MKQIIKSFTLLIAFLAGLYFGVPALYREVCSWSNVQAFFFCIYAVLPGLILLAVTAGDLIEELQDAISDYECPGVR